MKIAMWSGPRNLSTAMMYSFGNRADCAVVDEPFYAAFLKLTGDVHPMGAQICAHHPTDPVAIAMGLAGQNPDGKPIWYQKHMAHHMVDGVPRDWMRNVTNVFLIRHPARVIASYTAKRENPTVDDIGVRQQAQMYDELVRAGQSPLVIDSADIRNDPQGMLTKLCGALGIPFDAGMLSWPTGGHAADGIWASHWYGAVHQSTGFAGPEGELPKLEGVAAEILGETIPYYQSLVKKRLN